MTPTNLKELEELMASARYEAYYDHPTMVWATASEKGKDIFRKEARKELETFRSHGLAIVPIEATPSMCDAGEGFGLRCGCPDCDLAAWQKIAAGYTAMLNASPFKETA